MKNGINNCLDWKFYNSFSKLYVGALAAEPYLPILMQYCATHTYAYKTVIRCSSRQTEPHEKPCLVYSYGIYACMRNIPLVAAAQIIIIIKNK